MTEASETPEAVTDPEYKKEAWPDEEQGKEEEGEDGDGAKAQSSLKVWVVIGIATLLVFAVVAISLEAVAGPESG